MLGKLNDERKRGEKSEIREKGEIIKGRRREKEGCKCDEKWERTVIDIG